MRRPRGKRFDPASWNEAPAGNPFPRPEALQVWQFPRVKRFVGIRFSSSKRFPFGTGLNKPFPPNEALQFLSLGMAKRFAKSPRPEALQSGSKASAPSAIRLPGEKRFPRAGDQKCFPPNEAFPPFGFKNPPAEALQSKNEESASSAIQLLGRKRFPLLTLKNPWSKRFGLWPNLQNVGAKEALPRNEALQSGNRKVRCRQFSFWAGSASVSAAPQDEALPFPAKSEALQPLTHSFERSASPGPGLKIMNGRKRFSLKTKKVRHQQSGFWARSASPLLALKKSRSKRFGFCDPSG